jgi:pimeloyl-ACP methyl ester carboxylesterase
VLLIQVAAERLRVAQRAAAAGESGHRVWAIEYRSAGAARSRPAADIDTLAEDVHAFIEAKQLNGSGRGVDIVTRRRVVDRARARDQPSEGRAAPRPGGVLLPAPAPAASGVPSDAANLRTWQFSFNRLNDLGSARAGQRTRLPVLHLRHQERSRLKIDPAMLDQYVREYQTPGTLRASFNLYRANFSEAGIAQAKARAEKRVTVPVLAIGGGGGVRDLLQKSIQPIADDVQGAVLAGCGHFLPDECPDEFARAVTDFWSSRR